VIGRAENRSAEPQDAGHVARRQHPGAVRFDQAVETVLEADGLDAAVRGGFDDGADNGVEAGGIATARQDAKACDCRHRPAIVAGSIRRLRCGWSNPRSTIAIRG